MSDHDAFAERGRALEEEYFRKKDRELVEKMRQAAAAEQARGDMAKQTGLQDPALLAELQELGFTPETVGLLPLVPVLETAWAEGGVTPAERDLIVSLARTLNVAAGSPADAQLSRWMTDRPDGVVFQKAGRLIAAMLAGSGDAGGLKADDLVAYCERIAAASGGIFGTRLGSVSGEERALLSRIAADLKSRHG
jgi:hypothetical protein